MQSSGPLTETERWIRLESLSGLPEVGVKRWKLNQETETDFHQNSDIEYKFSLRLDHNMCCNTKL